jgi:hypothetical protein
VEGVTIVLANLIPYRFQGKPSSHAIAVSSKFHRSNDAGHHVVAHSHSCLVEVGLNVEPDADGDHLYVCRGEVQQRQPSKAAHSISSMLLDLVPSLLQLDRQRKQAIRR